MSTGILVQTFAFSLCGIELPATTLSIPKYRLAALLEPGIALRLKVHVTNAAEPVADTWASSFVQELYYRLLLRFAGRIERSEPPKLTDRNFIVAGEASATPAVVQITGNARVVHPTFLVPQPKIDAVAREIELRLITPQPPTSAQLYTAISMFATGLESQNKAVRFLVIYSAIALAALFKWHSGKQSNVDNLLLERNPKLAVSRSPNGKDESVYTKLRNDLIHAEDRGTDPAAAIAAIEASTGDFQNDASLVLASL